MHDPQRWNAFERDLLGEARGWEPPPRAKASTWKRVVAAATSATVATTIGAQAGATAAVTGSLLTAKTGIVAVTIALGTVLGAVAVEASYDAPIVVAPTASAVPVRRAPAGEVVPDAAAPAVLPVDAGVVPPSPSAAPLRLAPTATAQASTLQRDTAALLDARAALRNGEPNLARDRLLALRRTSPRSELRQEIDALLVEALFASGDDTRAAASAFLIAYPSSPYAARVREISSP